VSTLNFNKSCVETTMLHSNLSCSNFEAKAKDKIDLVFDKYIVNSAEELAELNKEVNLRGALVLTGDKKHVGIHKFFFVAQIISKLHEKIRGVFLGERKLDANLCHAMVIVGWDNTWNEKRKMQNNRPTEAHSVMDGVKFNAVDYFTYDDKDVDHLIVYVPKDQALKQEFAKNAELSSKISTIPENRSKFSWKNLLTCLFKKQIVETPTEKMQKSLAYVVTDLLLERKLSKGSNADKARDFFCMEYALTMLQSSIMTKTLSEEDKHSLMFEKGKKLSREDLAMKIYSSIKNKDESAPLAKAYWESRICSQLHAPSVLSSYASSFFDAMSEHKQV
jgi:hypothetical protein